MTHIYSYNEHSEGAKALAGALGAKRIKHKGSKFKGSIKKTLINWGSSDLPNELFKCTILNFPHLVGEVSNKLTFFKNMEFHQVEESCVPFTIEVDKVREWLQAGKTVVARTKLTGHSGEGIVLLEGADAEIVKAPLYTLYVPKKEEYRVHVSKAGVFDVQKKLKKEGVEDANFKIRNHQNGFIYARQDINTPECVTNVALAVFAATGLDFGAVDIIYNEKQKRAYVLEINTAPGLTGTTLENYVKMFQEIL